ncbi:MAG: alpha-amylase [Chitinophagales bacterium]|nr:alpha-amylase [Chitinophagales bacterium]
MVMIRYLLILSVVVLASCNKVQKEPVEDKQQVKTEIPGDPIEWTKNLNIYEVNIRQFTKEGTFDAFAMHLPRLQEMGVKILWLMPIQPIGIEKRKGSLGSYYSIKDYTDVNPEFGTMVDLKNLVDDAHDRGMYVILDWVANHSAWDIDLVEKHPEWFTRDENGNMIPPVPDWSDVVDFNYEEKGLWEYMINAMKFWVEEANIDGYRCDVAGEVPLEFWQQALDELQKIKPEVFMLAEHESPDDHNDAFHMTYGWEMHHIMNEMAKGKMDLKDLHAYFVKEDSLYPQEAYRMHFITNHDENSWNGTVEERMGEAAEAFAVLSVTAEQSMPLIYNGQEAGLNKRLAFFEKDEIEWKEHPMGKFYEKLLKLKLKNEALWNGIYGGDVELIDNNKMDNVLSFRREMNGDKVLVVLNLSKESVTVELANTDEGELKDLFTGERVEINAKHKEELASWGYRLYHN